MDRPICRRMYAYVYRCGRFDSLYIGGLKIHGLPPRPWKIETTIGDLVFREKRRKEGKNGQPHRDCLGREKDPNR